MRPFLYLKKKEMNFKNECKDNGGGIHNRSISYVSKQETFLLKIIMRVINL